MNKYEHARILAERAKQLENGAEPTVDITGLDDALRIAQKELREGVIPLSIKKREITNGFFEFENENLDSSEDESESLSRADDGTQNESGDESENENVDGEVSSDDGLGGNSDAISDDE